MIDINAAIDEAAGVLEQAAAFRSVCKYIIRPALIATAMPSLDVAAGTFVDSMTSGRQWQCTGQLICVIRNVHADRPANGAAFVELAYTCVQALRAAVGNTWDMVTSINVNPSIASNGEGSLVFQAVLTVQIMQERY